MTHKTAPPSLRKIFPIVFIILIPLLGCNLLNRVGIGSSKSESMSVEEALVTTPLDSRPTFMEEMGPPDAFTITFQELEGQIVRWESWFYFDFTSQFDFIDGELLWNIELEEVPDGSIFAHFYDPRDFTAGMSPEDVRDLLADQELLEVNLAALDQENALALAGDQILLGFDNDQLVYVETVILSPDPEGIPLGDVPPAQIPESSPSQEEQKKSSLRDQFETDTPLAVPIAIDEFMTLENVDGQGKFTTSAAQSLMVAYYPDFMLADFVLEVDITFQDPGIGTKAGVIFRGEDPQKGMDHYLHIAIAPVEETLILSVFRESEWKRWDVIDIPADLLQPDGSYHLGITCFEGVTLVLLDDLQVALLKDSDLINPGVFGLSLAAYDVPDTVLFDNLVISEHPGQ